MVPLVIVILVVVALMAVFWKRLPIAGVVPYLVHRPINLGGTVQTIQLDGDVAGKQTFFIYLPTGYEDSEQRYRTIYHLHGAGVQETWVKHECENLGKHLEAAIANRVVEPMIIVCAYDPTGSSMWSDSFDGQIQAWTALTQDLIPHVDTNYRTLAERSGRIIQGFSMGGFGAIMNAFKSPELFGTLVVLDGALHNWETISTMRKGITSTMFETESYFNQWSPWQLTSEGTDVDIDMYLLWGEMPITKDFGERFRTHLEPLNREITSVESSCPHSMFCIMDKHGADLFQFITNSVARQEQRESN